MESACKKPRISGDGIVPHNSYNFSLTGVLSAQSDITELDSDTQLVQVNPNVKDRLLSESKISRCKKETELEMLLGTVKEKLKIHADCDDFVRVLVDKDDGDVKTDDLQSRSSKNVTLSLSKKSKIGSNMAAASRARSEKRVSQWEELMRKFSEAHKEECKTAASMNIPRAQRSVKLFPTGSRYEGSWDLLGMSGFGTYTFPNGVIYTGDFEDGMFHGNGELVYPEGASLRGVWDKGHMQQRTLRFADGLEYSETDWKYCMMPDRRFTVEYVNGLQPGGKSYLTADQPTKEIPEGFYDAGDGFYDSNTKIVYSYNNITSIVRSPSPVEQRWIVNNCRMNPIKPLGPRKDLYEEWSEPQPNPEPPQPPAAPTNTTMRRSSSFSDYDTDDIGAYYETLGPGLSHISRSRQYLTHRHSFHDAPSSMNSSCTDLSKR